MGTENESVLVGLDLSSKLRELDGFVGGVAGEEQQVAWLHHQSKTPEISQ
jgi:hypothetical protein